MDEKPPCMEDSECASDEICNTSGACVVEQGLCASSAECEAGRFCVPRDEMGGKNICDRVVRCDEVDARDVSALCRLNNDLFGNEKFRCDVTIPDAPTCIREDTPPMDMGMDMDMDMLGDMPDMMDMGDMNQPSGCQSSNECAPFGEYCLAGTVNTCGIPTTCDEVIAQDRVEFCSRDSGFSLRACDPMSTSQDKCEQVDEPYFIKIQDVSSGNASCDQTDPGSDIMGVRLRDQRFNRVLAWGSAFNEATGTSGSMTNRYDTTVRLDGFANGFSDEAMCPAQGQRLSELMPPPFATGCGGWVLIGFLNDFGEVERLEPGMHVEVLEYGSTCGGSSNDRYQVQICNDAESVLMGSDASCIYDLGAVSEGYGVFSLGQLPMPDF